MKHIKSRLNFLLVGFFLIWPFGSLLYSFYNFRNSFSKNILWLFAAYYGYTIIIYTENLDANRYVIEFEQIAQGGILFRQIFANYFTDSYTLDLFKPLLMIIVAFFTDNFRVLFCVVGIVFGFFFSRNLWFILERIESKIGPFLFITLVSLAFISPLHGIQFIRFSTATHIFIYGVLLYCVERNKSGLIVASMSVLVHFSFLLPVILLLVYSILPKKIDIYLVFFVVTAFIIEIDLPVLSSFMKSSLPAVFQPRVESYTNIDYADKIAESTIATNWYIRYISAIFKYLSYAYIFWLSIKGRDFINRNPGILYLFCFSLFLYGWANITSIMPSGTRYAIPAQYLLFSIVALYYASTQITWFSAPLRFVSVPILLLFIVVMFRIGIDSMGLMLFLGNPIFALLVTDNTPLIEYIKGLIAI